MKIQAENLSVSTAPPSSIHPDLTALFVADRLADIAFQIVNGTVPITDPDAMTRTAALLLDALASIHDATRAPAAPATRK